MSSTPEATPLSLPDRQGLQLFPNPLRTEARMAGGLLCSVRGCGPRVPATGLMGVTGTWAFSAEGRVQGPEALSETGGLGRVPGYSARFSWIGSDQAARPLEDEP